LNVFEPTYGPFAHLCSKKITSLLSVDGDDARFSEIADVTWLHAATIVSICVLGNRWTDGGKIQQLILEDPRRSVRHCNCSRGCCFVAGKMCQVASRQFFTGSIL
jgi:hypothetical protein